MAGSSQISRDRVNMSKRVRKQRNTTLAQHEDTEFGTYRDDKHELNDRQLRSFSIEHALIQGRPKMAHSVLLS